LSSVRKPVSTIATVICVVVFANEKPVKRRVQMVFHITPRMVERRLLSCRRGPVLTRTRKPTSSLQLFLVSARLDCCVFSAVQHQIGPVDHFWLAGVAQQTFKFSR
jgi:hypothetical protein